MSRQPRRFNRRISVVVAVLLAWSAAAVGLAATPASADSSTVTVSGSGPFSSLKITVDQTSNLVNQVVHVTWSGGQPTQGQANFLQIMQCWGDSTFGPDREQCQFGGFENQLGGWASTRQVYYGGAISDSKETYLPPPGSGNPVYVPFHAVDNDPDVALGNTNKFYDANTTNEVARGMTYSDGTGEAFFQVQTAREAPGLGCGAAIDDVTTSAVERARHKCWLVVVPRAGDELPGITTPNTGGVVTSPLSVTNWAQHIAIPLDFQPIGTSCPIDAVELPTFGTELAVGAVASWQPTLCSQTSNVFSYTQVPDDLARNAAISIDPTQSGLAFVGKPIPTDQAGSAHLAYAPLTVSGIGIGFVVERTSLFGTPAAARVLDGSRVASIKLTPRLVAKLLTQSYVSASPANNPAVQQNVQVAGRTAPLPAYLLASSLGTDPEFVRLNPDFVTLDTSLADSLVPYIPSDAVSLLWEWVNADKDARDFLAGKPDFDSPWYTDCGQSAKPVRCLQPIDCAKFTDSRGVNGCPTYVNPAYQGLALPLNTVPKQDNHCLERDQLPPLCTLDQAPYANGFGDAANDASRGDSLTRQIYNGISYSKNPVQTPGSRNLMALTDTVSAARYALTMASLRNGAGDFVAPTSDSMTKAVAAMEPDANGVLVPDPATTASGAYPLTAVTYAVVNRDTLSDAQRAGYADFLSYAATTGQTPGTTSGTLPPGYLPLPASLRRATLAASVTVATPPPPAPTPSVPATPSPSASASASPSATATLTSTPSASPVPSANPLPTTVPGVTQPTPASQPSSSAPAPSPSASAQPTQTPVTAAVALTQPVTAGAGALGVAAALVLGATAAVGAAVALRFASGGSS